jgi:Mrp family chromosome partitioning ATPase
MEQKLNDLISTSKFLVMSGKGGVENQCAVNLGIALGNKGIRSALVDADLHGPDVP